MSIFAPVRLASRRLQKTVQMTCAEPVCRNEIKHGACVDCSERTCSREQRIEEETLRRYKPFVCWSCSDTQPHNQSQRARQLQLRAMRTEHDWTKVSTPIETGALRGETMPEQYASKARAAVRAFFDAGFDVATVRDSDSTTLNVSIQTLGLQGRVYAEVRDGETVLRRIRNA